MPYTLKNLPENIKKLDKNKQEQWVEVWNSVYKKELEKGTDKDEAERLAFVQANGVVKVSRENSQGQGKGEAHGKGEGPKGEPKSESFNESVYSFQLLESTEKGNVWDVVLIKAGYSDNKGSHGYQRYYPEETLKKKEVIQLFENAPAMAYKFEGKLEDIFDHQTETLREKHPKGLAGNQVGFFDNVRFGEFNYQGKKAKGILAKFHVAEGADWLRKNLKQAWDRGKKILGFSIDADGSEKPKLLGEKMVDWVENISQVIENTVVTRPAAGGQVLRLVASQTNNKETIMDREKIIKLLQEKAPKFLEGKKVDDLTDEELVSLLTEALNEKEAEKKKVEEPEKEPEQKAKKEELEKKVEEPKINESEIDKKIKRLESLTESISLREAQIEFKSRLAESNLPEAIQNKLKKRYADKVLTEDEMNDVIGDEQDTWAKLNESMPKSETSAKITSDEKTKFELAMDGFWEGEDQKDKDGKKVKAFTSFKEAYATVVKDHSAVYADPHIIIADSYWFMPDIEEASFAESYNVKRKRALMESHMTEALTVSSWSEILGNTLNRKMMKEWADDEYQVWRKIVSSIVPVRDFRTQRRLQMGGYGVLSTVSEQATYQPLTSPLDTESTYSPAKKGGLESLTMEMVANDDVGSIRMIPKKLGKAAAITLYRDIFNMFINNKEQDGSTTLASAARGNAEASHVALSHANFSSAVAQMKELTKYSGTSPDNVDYLGSAFMPKYIITAAELEDLANRIYKSEVAVAMTGGGTDGSKTVYNATEPNLHKGKAEPIILPYWTDADDWWLVADPKKAPTIEVGFFNGKQEPELFVQDNPTVGSVFTADKITYKVRYIYGYGILDYRSFYYSNA